MLDSIRHPSLAQNLPGDVLEQILFHFAQSCRDDIDPFQPLKSFTVVNCHWNQVAHSSPRLWRNLGHIRVYHRKCHPETVANDFMASLEARLEHAKSQPLTFAVTVATLTYATLAVQAVAERAVSLLTQHAAQWKNVQIFLPTRYVNMLASVAGNVPLLETLSLEIQQPDVLPQLDQFAVAPRLRHVAFRFMGRYADVRGKLRLPWSQLLSYHEQTHVRDAGFHPTITTSKNLQSLISTIPYQHPPHFPNAPFHHARLTRLHLNFTSADSSLLRRLVLPSLTDLSVAAIGTWAIFGDITELIHHSSCSLNALAILPVCSTWYEQTRALTRVLNHCPTLIRLKVNSIPLEDLQNLSRSSNGAAGLLVPFLKQLIISYASTYPMIPEADYSALGSLACAREEMYQSGVTSVPLEVWVETVPTFQMKEPFWTRVLMLLEGFPNDAAKMRRVRNWAEVLRAQIVAVRGPAEDSWTEEDAPNPTLLKKGVNGVQLWKVYQEMNAFNFAKDDAGLLYAGDIPRLLEQVASLPPTSFPLEKVLGLSTRATALLERWTPFLIVHAKAYRRWMRRGKHSIEYVSQISERRHRDDLVWEMVVGAPPKVRTHAQWLDEGIWL
ncbi:hypothetical protein DFP72DRAFT_1060581 [Ephemerocybe angulata]|uniref:F-box domain-containing protein n=1 Tax=Ephemerocybe angulata TaxID=980116 RepID=A0A8H6IFV6_9AGAR|nr:hypothetical protein DFP72DRAFT_1060581 [Tulosesus angulatus]